MQPACIRHTDLPGTSRLFADFSYHFEKVAAFYGHDPNNPASLKQAVAEIDYPAERRAALVAALTAQNGPSESLKRLAEPGTVVVVTGQQVGLFAGPAYTLYKALSAARLARQLTEIGTPAVPVFWLATEDHDFPEVDHTWVFDKSGDSTLVRLPSPQEGAGRPRPVGGIAIAHPPIEELRRALDGMPFAADVLAAVEQAYKPGATMGAAFRALMQSIAGKLGLIFLDPLDPAIRKIAAPFLADALRAAPQLKADLLARTRVLTEAGYHAQVHVDAKTSLFFLLENGERVTLRRKDAEYAEMANRAEHISPNALLRPVMQDYLLPSVAFIGGPGELAYLAQSQVLYERLLGRMPVMLARSGFTLLDPRSAKLLNRYHLATVQTFVHQEALREQIAQALVPDQVIKSMESAKGEVARRIDALRADLQAFDPTLGRAMDKSRSKILYQMEKMARKTAREALRRDARAAADAKHLGSLLYPHRHLQERFYSILPFLAQHGLDLVDRIYDAADPGCPDHRVFTI